MALTDFARSFLEREPVSTQSISGELIRAGLAPYGRKGAATAGERIREAMQPTPAVGDPRIRVMTGALPIGLPAQAIPMVMRNLPAIAAGAGALFAGAQALGLGAGEGLFGTDLFPQQQQLEPGGVPFEGPGLREPSAEYVVKEWKRRIDSRDGDYNLQFYLVKMPGRAYRIYMYSQRTGGWKSWGLPRPAVIGKNMPSHRMLTRLRRNLKKHAADAKTILQVASPTAYAKQLGYRKPAHRHTTHRR